jgi:hypothetical protein
MAGMGDPSRKSDFLRWPTWVEWVVIAGIVLVTYFAFFGPNLIE